MSGGLFEQSGRTFTSQAAKLIAGTLMSLSLVMGCSTNDSMQPAGGGQGGCSSCENQNGTGESGTGGESGLGGASSPPLVSCAPAPTSPTETAELQGSEAPDAMVKMHLNHIGYERCGPKRIVVESDQPLTSFQVVNSQGETVWFEAPLESGGNFDAWGGAPHHYVADFSSLLAKGEFKLRVNGTMSPSFRIDDELLLGTTADAVLSFLNQSRATDSAVSQADQSVPLFGGGGTADVRGGWYDASGDISKYLSHLHYANFMNPQQIPLTAWALAWFAEGRAGGDPTRKQKARDEALFGADYLIRVQAPAGYFYTNVFDGWTGDLQDRDICAFARGFDGTETNNGVKNANYQAAFREGGGMSIAALAKIASWEQSGSFDSATYLKAAESGFAHLLVHGPSYCNDGKENIIDDYSALLAASELYATTSKPAYLEAARTRATRLAERLHEVGYFIADDGDRPFWHAADAGLPIVALVRYRQIEADTARRAVVDGTIKGHLDYLVDVTTETANPFGYARQTFEVGGKPQNGFFIPHDNETNYWWQGESARLASLAAAALLGGRVVAETPGALGVSAELGRYAISQLDWILGSNPLDISFLAGFGRNNPPSYCVSRAPYHGHLTGGISNGITGSNADGSGFQWMTTTTPQECWRNWRWVEQWLPHATWYLIALAAVGSE